MISVSLVGVAAVFVHTVLCLLLAGLFVVVLFFPRDSKGASILTMLAIVAVSAVLIVVYFWYLKPLKGQWNSSVTWRYTSVRNLTASIFRLGWPVALFSAIGVALAIRERGPQDRYWLCWAAVWAGTCLVMPFLMPYRPVYSFPFALPPFVLAGKVIGRLHDAWAVRPFWRDAVFATFIVLLNFPSVARHYVDGSCSDYRTAAGYVRERFQPGDSVMAISPDLLKHYGANQVEALEMEMYDSKAAIDSLQRPREDSGRIWVVLNYGRAARPTAILEWLRHIGAHEHNICHLRYDYSEFTTNVFLVTKSK